jgi:hypothetical protein
LYEEPKPPRTRRILIAALSISMLVLSLFLIIWFTRTFLGANLAQNLTSTDWAGYVVASDLINPRPVLRYLSASWTVPVTEVSPRSTYSAAWIGIGGQRDDTLIQIGTEQDSAGGRIAYSAWYELYPSNSVTIAAIEVSAGDSISASINLTDSTTNQWELRITDTTKGQGFDETFFYDSSRLTAEWIVERPIVRNAISTLANFGTLTFNNLTVATDSQSGTPTVFSFSRITMYDRQNNQLVTISSLSVGGSSFTVTYLD